MIYFFGVLMGKGKRIVKLKRDIILPFAFLVVMVLGLYSAALIANNMNLEKLYEDDDNPKCKVDLIIDDTYSLMGEMRRPVKFTFVTWEDNQPLEDAIVGYDIINKVGGSTQDLGGPQIGVTNENGEVLWLNPKAPIDSHCLIFDVHCKDGRKFNFGIEYKHDLVGVMVTVINNYDDYKKAQAASASKP